jgi:Neuraminidase (sialidase)
VVWDATGGQFNNRIYLVYTDRITLNTNDTDIWMRTSTDDGTTWSAPVRVNDDATTNSQFLPYVALDPTTGTVGVSFHDCRNDDGVNGTNNIPNDDAEYYGTFSTDGGVTWAPNTRLSGGFSNASDSGNSIDYGDFVGSSALAGKLYTAWADNANCDGTNPDGTLHQFDLYANPLMLPGATPTPTPRATPRPRPTPHPRPSR